MQSRDPTALVQAIILAKMTGVDEEKVQQAEDLMNELVVPSEEHGRSFYAPAPKTEKESVAEEAPTQKKKKKSWAGLLNTGPKYAGRNREDRSDCLGMCDPRFPWNVISLEGVS